jgi:hypothetical protein
VDELLTPEKIAEYEEDARGPGKFEGEASYVPYYWELYMRGFADKDDGRTLRFRVTPEERGAFSPDLKGRRVITLLEREDGFVVELNPTG